MLSWEELKRWKGEHGESVLYPQVEPANESRKASPAKKDSTENDPEDDAAQDINAETAESGDMARINRATSSEPSNVAICDDIASAAQGSNCQMPQSEEDQSADTLVKSSATAENSDETASVITVIRLESGTAGPSFADRGQPDDLVADAQTALDGPAIAALELPILDDF